jgi:subtilisin family serine protease
MSASVDDLLLAAQQRGDDSLETGRYIITYKEEAREAAGKSLQAQGFRTADARDFKEQAVSLADVGDADAVYFPEIGVAAVSGDAYRSSALGVQEELAGDSPIEAIEPEYFAFADSDQDRYLRGFRRAAQVIEEDLRSAQEVEDELEAAVLGATWGLAACRVPPSTRNGLGIRTAVLDTGFDLGHPDFAGRPIVSATFVGQPVQDLHSHGTHCAGTAMGPLAPPGTTPRYGIAHRAQMYIGKVLNNAGGGSTATVLAGMNWAIHNANRCAVISMSLGAATPVQAAYTAAGASALSRGLLIIAAAGNHNGATGAPANSPTIMAVASLDNNLRRSSFSAFGKIEIAGPGRDVFSSVPRPTRYGIKTGTSMATPHVAGCAALWAQTNPTLRGMALWRKLQATARPLADPPTHVGRGLVQAPV